MICVDSSVAVKWILQEDFADRARALLRDSIAADERIVAPSLLPLEITNILRQRMRAASGISLAEARTLLSDFLALRIAILTPDGLHLRALEIAAEFGLPAAYDAHYLALAGQLNCTLWTDDRRLHRAMVSGSIHVRLIGEYVSEAR